VRMTSPASFHRPGRVTCASFPLTPLEHFLEPQTESISSPEGVVEDTAANGDAFPTAWRHVFHAGTLGEVE